MTDIPASLADLDDRAGGHGSANEPPEMGPHPADQPQTDGSSALAPVVKIGDRRQPTTMNR